MTIVDLELNEENLTERVYRVASSMDRALAGGFYEDSKDLEWAWNQAVELNKKGLWKHQDVYTVSTYTFDHPPTVITSVELSYYCS